MLKAFNLYCVIQTPRSQYSPIPIDWLSVGELLYTALKPWTKPGFLRIRQWYSLIPNGTKADIAKDLPLSLPTRKLLFGKFTANQCIADRLKTLGIRSVQIEAEIEILIRLGLYKIGANAEINMRKVKNKIYHKSHLTAGQSLENKHCRML